MTPHITVERYFREDKLQSQIKGFIGTYLQKPEMLKQIQLTISPYKTVTGQWEFKLKETVVFDDM